MSVPESAGPPPRKSIIDAQETDKLRVLRPGEWRLQIDGTGGIQAGSAPVTPANDTKMLPNALKCSAGVPPVIHCLLEQV